MYILGFSDSVHDRSVCIFKDNEPVVALEEERISRVKHGLKLYNESRKQPDIFSQMKLEERDSKESEAGLTGVIDYCLNSLSLTPDDIHLFIGNSLHSAFPFHDKAVYINHHMAHAASTFYSSGFEEAAILVTDGYGDISAPHRYETVLIAKGNHNKITQIKTVEGSVSNYYDMQNSIGVFYRIGSLLAGFGMFDEGKTMGLSAYGKPSYYDELKKYLSYEGDQVLIDNKGVWENLSKSIVDREKFEVRADIAASFQKHLEEIVTYYANVAFEKTGLDSLCIAGGVGLNCVSNAKLFNTTRFKNIYVFSATGDNGISMGAAYFAAHQIYNLPRTPQLTHSYFGRKYLPSEEKVALEKNSEKIEYQELSSEDLTTKAVDLLVNGEILMWFQDGSELGPRALGHRSILASSKKVETKDYINAKVKFREMFRPLAPIILEEYATEYFDFGTKSPFMLFSPKVLPKTIDEAPAIVHIDGTSRLQTLGREQNSKLYGIIDAFRIRTGTPIVLNTSFNGKDEPIVETPEEAIRTFLNSPVKHLFLDNFYVTKKANA